MVPAETTRLVDMATLVATRLPVVMPTAGAARLLQSALDRTTGGTWEPPDLVAWSSWVVRCFDAARLAGDRGAEFVLGAEQELALWQRVLAAEGAPSQAAPLAQEAWRLAHAWRLPWSDAAPLNEDAQAFRRWARAYRARTAELGATDVARVPELLTAPAAGTALAHGFIAPAPTLAAWLGPSGGAPTADPGRFRGAAYPDRASELEAALDWAVERARAEPAARVVIALPHLARERALVTRALRDVLGLAPAVNVRTAVPETLLSLPVMQSALAVIALEPVPRWDALSAVILSPHTVGAAAECGARAAFDADLRAGGRYEPPLADVAALAAAAAGVPQLARLLSALVAVQAQAPRRQALNGWRTHFERCLDAVGWPGGLPYERAARAAWIDLGDRLQRFDTVLPAVGLGEARARLRQLLDDTGVPDDGGTAGIHLVTPEVALVLAPDHLWLAAAEVDAFAAPGGPSPLLSYAAQRAAGVPGADAARDLSRAQRLVGLLAHGGGSRIASYCAGDGEQTFSPSPLIPALAGSTALPGRRAPPASWPLPEVTLESVVDSCGTPLTDPAAPLAGGVGALAAQAACPFRAYARHRLTATAVDEPRPGLDARVRGTFVHRVLALVWSQLHAHAALVALAPADMTELLDSAISRALADWQFATPLERALAALERTRLAAVARAWLEFERSRPPFTVRAVEQPATVEYGGLTLRTRIDRLDRLADGRERIVDYKTGLCRMSAWQPPRVDEPQLPFYALTNPSRDLAGIAFAKVAVAEPGWIELPPAGAEADDAAAIWQATCAAWADDLAMLADELRRGVATVSPKRGGQTCRYCEQALLCRIADAVDDGADLGEGDSEPVDAGRPAEQSE